MNIFVIGNSLTQDTIPGQYGADFHIRANSGLQIIYDSPTTNLLTGSIDWPTAFAATQYDLISVQPYRTSSETDSLNQNTTVISEWAALQPNAVFIIHTAWAPFADHSEQYATNGEDSGGLLSWNRGYYEELITRLRAANPGTAFKVTPAINVLESINRDIVQGIGPYTALSDLYRDALHMNTDGGGFYLQHNLMRRTLGLSLVNSNATTFPAETRLYLNTKIRAAVPIGIPITPAQGVDHLYGGI